MDLYNKALRLQCNKEFDEAEAIIRQLIKENIPQLEAEGGLPKTMSTLKFSCYTNLGSISMKKGEIKDSLENYLLVCLRHIFIYLFIFIICCSRFFTTSL